MPRLAERHRSQRWALSNELSNSLLCWVNEAKIQSAIRTWAWSTCTYVEVEYVWYHYERMEGQSTSHEEMYPKWRNASTHNNAYLSSATNITTVILYCPTIHPYNYLVLICMKKVLLTALISTCSTYRKRVFKIKIQKTLTRPISSFYPSSIRIPNIQ